MECLTATSERKGPVVIMDCIHPCKKTNKLQLIFARLHYRFLHNNDCSSLELSKWELNCCKPYRIVESGSDFVEEVLGGEQDIIVIYNIYISL